MRVAGYTAICVAVSIASAACLAAPAAWYRWTSKRDGTEVCAQVSPGDGWTRRSGPYKDAQCSTEGMPGR